MAEKSNQKNHSEGRMSEPTKCAKDIVLGVLKEYRERSDRSPESLVALFEGAIEELIATIASKDVDRVLYNEANKILALQVSEKDVEIVRLKDEIIKSYEKGCHDGRLSALRETINFVGD